MRIDEGMGRRDGSRGAWVLRLLLVVSLAAAVALTGQSQALAQDDGDGSSIELDTDWGTGGIVSEQLKNPYSVAVDDDGNVYVADTGNHRIQRFDSDGKLDDNWGEGGTVGSKGAGEGEFHNPNGVAVGPDGSVYVADTNNSRIVKFIDTVPVSAEGNGAGGDCSDHSAFTAMIEDDIDAGAMFDELVFGGQLVIDCGAFPADSEILAGQLKEVTVEPKGMAGRLGDVNVSFITTNPVPAGGKVVVTFSPNTFEVVEGANDDDQVEVLLGEEENQESLSARVVEGEPDSGPSVTIELTALAEPAIPEETKVVLTLTGIKHPGMSGKFEGGSIKTTDSEGITIDECLIEDCEIVYTDVEPGILTGLEFRLQSVNLRGGLFLDISELNLPEVREVEIADGRTLELLPTAAGSTGEVLVIFTTGNPVPKGGEVEVTFPEGFDAVDVGGGVPGEIWPSHAADEGIPTNPASKFDSDYSYVSNPLSITGTATYRLEGPSVIIKLRRDVGLPSGSKVHLRLSGIKNPEVTGDPKGGVIETRDKESKVIDQSINEEQLKEACGESVVVAEEREYQSDIDCDLDWEVKVDGITPGRLIKNKIELTKQRAGETGLVTVTFQLDNPLPADGAIAVTFPEGFSFEEFAQATLTACNRTRTPGRAAPCGVRETPSPEHLDHSQIQHGGRTTVLLMRTGDGRIADGWLVTVELTDITNPRMSGPTQHFEIRTSLGK
jgi:hypothetical protein